MCRFENMYDLEDVVSHCFSSKEWKKGFTNKENKE